jgi:hypothetical protein
VRLAETLRWEARAQFIEQRCFRAGIACDLADVGEGYPQAVGVKYVKSILEVKKLGG